MDLVYLDHAATTPTDPDVAAAMRPFIQGGFGNPSAVYRLGRESRAAVEEARLRVASLIGASPGEIVFTSGGTESDNMALAGALSANQKKGRHLLTTSIEHHAVLETSLWLRKKGVDITLVGVDSRGLVDPGEIKKALRPDTVIVSVMHANNEVGTVQPLEEVSRICRESGVLLHTDAVQTVGNIPVDAGELGVDLLSLSSHKLYGPKGVGALYVRKGTRLDPIIHGGEQEGRRRAGTENVPGIVGLGAAAVKASGVMEKRIPEIAGLRDRLVEGVLQRIEGAGLSGDPVRRLPNNAHFVFENVEGEAVCLQLDTLGICASTGSACTSEALEPSHVLVAMGVDPELAQGSLRLTLGRDTTPEQIDYVLENLPAVISRLRAMHPASWT